MALAPNYATAHSWYANTLTARGRFDEALEQPHQASRLDPLSMPIGYAIGETLIYARRWDDALRQARAMLELDST
jgi:tetratricopeptide (TPR) repeat protein